MTRGQFVVDLAGIPVFSADPGRTDFLMCGPDGLEGWWDSPELRLNQSDIPNGQGQFDLPAYFSSRVLSISGTAIASNSRNLNMLRNQLNQLSTLDPFDITVTEDGLALTVVGRIGAALKWRPYSGAPYAEFHLQLWCPDPLKYGQRNQFSMASDGAYLDIYHRGDFTAYPRVVITGSAAGGYELMHPSGAVYQVDKPLVTGHPHEVDMRTGLLRVDGVVDMAGVTGASVWHVPPGGYHQMKVRPLTVGQTATAICYVTDTYA